MGEKGRGVGLRQARRWKTTMEGDEEKKKHGSDESGIGETEMG